MVIGWYCGNFILLKKYRRKRHTCDLSCSLYLNVASASSKHLSYSLSLSNSSAIVSSFSCTILCRWALISPLSLAIFSTYREGNNTKILLFCYEKQLDCQWKNPSFSTSVVTKFSYKACGNECTAQNKRHFANHDKLENCNTICSTEKETYFKPSTPLFVLWAVLIMIIHNKGHFHHKSYWNR